jgi:hypothetical protein
MPVERLGGQMRGTRAGGISGVGFDAEEVEGAGLQPRHAMCRHETASAAEAALQECRNLPSGAKARGFRMPIMYGLKPAPFTEGLKAHDRLPGRGAGLLKHLGLMEWTADPSTALPFGFAPVGMTKERVAASVEFGGWWSEWWSDTRMTMERAAASVEYGGCPLRIASLRIAPRVAGAAVSP